MVNYSRSFIDAVMQTAGHIMFNEIEQMVPILDVIRFQSGRLFVLGVGGSAANASHAVNDFRKLCSIEAYAPTDNVAELSARTNDDGWESVFSNWLAVSRISNRDAILVLSVGGGNAEKNVSVNLIKAIDLAKAVGAKVLGVVGRDGGYTAKNADAVVIIPTEDADGLVTPLTEVFQAVIWHCLVSHPSLAVQKAKWESVAA